MKLLIACGWLMVAALAGVGLYDIAYEVDRMTGELATLEREIRRESESIHVLSAEWTYLARPVRIAELTVRYLPELRRLEVDQIGRMDDLRTLPPADTLEALPRPRPATPASFMAHWGRAAR